jgi:nucleotidyltransferase substrate binding protein (TIGR01987 family)
VERLKERLAVARKAIGTLETILKEPKTPIVRDASIQRFEYSFEALWKAAQLYLRNMESLELGSPKAVIRASMQVGLLDVEQARIALQIADDRNRTVHTYNEELADAIYDRIRNYAPVMSDLVRAMQDRVENQAEG